MFDSILNPEAEAVPTYIEDSQSGRVFLNVYTLSREYGGPEEGGWWYDHYTPRETLNVSYMTNSEIHAIYSLVSAHYRRVEEGERYTDVNSNGVTRVIVEDAEPTETQRPHYE